MTFYCLNVIHKLFKSWLKFRSTHAHFAPVFTHGCVSYLGCGIQMQMEDDSIDDSCLGQHPHGETSRVQAAINIRGAGEVAGGEVERQGGLGS